VPRRIIDAVEIVGFDETWHRRRRNGKCVAIGAVGQRPVGSRVVRVGNVEGVSGRLEQRGGVLDALAERTSVRPGVSGVAGRVKTRWPNAGMCGYPH
jgi:hypothetical protein